MLKSSQVIFQESPRDHRTEVPNIVLEMLESGELSMCAFTLYCVYRKIAGQTGECWIGTRSLAKKSRMSNNTLTKSKKLLSSPFQKLNGMSLITVTPGEKKLEEADIVSINDVWTANHNYFKNKPTCSKSKYTPVANGSTTLSQMEVHKKEPIKKEPIIIAKPEIPREPEPPKQDAAAGNNNQIYDCLKIATDLSERQKAQLARYPEPVVLKAVKYCYHPTVKLKGPQARIKQLHAFCKNPEDYDDSWKDLDNPQAKMSPKEKVLTAFTKGKLYNGFEFCADDNGAGFIIPNNKRQGSTQSYLGIEWKDKTWYDKWLKIIERIRKDVPT